MIPATGPIVSGSGRTRLCDLGHRHRSLANAAACCEDLRRRADERRRLEAARLEQLELKLRVR